MAHSLGCEVPSSFRYLPFYLGDLGVAVKILSVTHMATSKT